MFIRSLCIQKQKTTFIKCYQLTVFFFRGLIFCIKFLKMNKGSIFFIMANIAFLVEGKKREKAIGFDPHSHCFLGNYFGYWRNGTYRRSHL